MAEAQAGGPANRADIRPSPEDGCAECGELVGHEWAFYRQDPGNPQTLQ
jgi:hypothetical protein